MGSQTSSLRSTCQTTPAPLLPELIECILDHLQHDRATLLSCSRVSHTWLRPSRRRLFRRVSTKLVDGEPDAVSFLKKIQDRPHIGELIQVLELTTIGQTVCTQHTLPAILGHLPGLRELQLRGLHSTCSCLSPPSGHLVVPRGVFRLHRLELTLLVHSSIPSFLDLIGMFSHIRVLRITYDSVAYFRGSVLLKQGILTSLSPDAFPLTKVDALKIHMSTAATSALILFHVLPHSPSTLTLHSLETSFDSSAQLRACAALLQSFPRIRHVDFGQSLTFNSVDHAAWDVIDLSQCKDLQNCVLRTTICQYEPYAEIIHNKRQQNMSIIGVIGRLPPSVEHIKIASVETEWTLDSFRDCYDWEEMHNLMSNLPGLRTLTFEICGHSRNSNVLALYQDFILSKTRNRCLVNIEYVDGWL